MPETAALPSYASLDSLDESSAYEAGMAAARFVAAPPEGCSADRLERAARYRDTALGRWASLLPAGTRPTKTEPATHFASLSCGGHAWLWATDAEEGAVEYHLAGCDTEWCDATQPQSALKPQEPPADVK